MISVADEIVYTEEEKTRMREACNVLLSEWSICRDRDDKSKQFYDLVANSRYRPHIEQVLDAVGFELLVSSGTGRQVAYLRGTDSKTRASFDKLESITILRLYQIYLMNRTQASMTGSISTTDVDEIMAKVNAMSNKQVDVKTMCRILYHLEEYNLVRIDERKKKDFSITTTITILPSISCMLPNETQQSLSERLEEYQKEAAGRPRKVVPGTDEDGEGEDE